MIEIVKFLNQVEMNIMPFLEKAVIPEKYKKIEQAIANARLQGEETKLIHYLGKREGMPVHYLQIDFIGHDSLYVVVEQDELR